MKKVKYHLIDGGFWEVEYDETAPCRVCGLPVVDASMGGTDICPWCDCGVFRNGDKFTLQEMLDPELIKKKARKLYESMPII